MKMRNILILSFIVAVFATTGCKKNIETDIVGTWNYQTLDTQEQGSATWTFKEDGTLIRAYLKGGDWLRDTCVYTVNTSLFKKQLKVQYSKQLTGITDINGTFRIDKFKNDILIMTRIETSDGSKDGAYLRCEMIKQ